MVAKRDRLVTAIAGHIVVSFKYGAGGIRVGEPYLLHTVNSHELLEVYQRAGPSTGGQHEGWKRLSIQRMTSLRLLGNVYKLRPDFVPLEQRAKLRRGA